MSGIVLSDRYNVIEIIKEEKELWVRATLVGLGMTAEELEPTDNINSLLKYNLEVWDHIDNGDVEIIQNNILVAKWYAPKLIPKYDEKNNIYYEIHLDYDSISDNEFHSPGEDV